MDSNMNIEDSKYCCR